jgi:hypothetical protein
MCRTWKTRLLFSVARFLVTSRLLHWHLRRRGLRVVVFCPQTAEEFAAAFAAGVDGVMTGDRCPRLTRVAPATHRRGGVADYPSRLSEFLEATQRSNGLVHPIMS